MYNQRAKVFTVFYALLLLVMVLRLAQMQLLPNSGLQDRIRQLKELRGDSQQTKSLRGRILDRHGEVLAGEEAVFKLYVDYGLIRYEDERVRQAMRMRARQIDAERQPGLLAKTNPDTKDGDALRRVTQRIQAKRAIIARLLDKSPEFEADPKQVEHEIQAQNNRIWNERLFQAWNIHCKRSAFHQANRHRINAVLVSDAAEDFARLYTDPNKQLLLISASNTITKDMQQPFGLVTLKTDDDVLAAHLAFLDIPDIEVRPEAVRRYYFEDAAAHTIGWIGPAAGTQDLFADDPLKRYRTGELSGREDGVEYVCESILRGSRGERFRDIDHHLRHLAKTEHGQDVQLTLDIRLQQQIEKFLEEHPHASTCNGCCAAVVLDVMKNEILVLASIPTFDPARVRFDYRTLQNDPRHPLRNRAINKAYPPGSVAKPLVAVAGLESGAIDPSQAISCPNQAAPPGWPNCWIFKEAHIGHDTLWPDNNARNAIKGSCNIYFSHLATLMDPQVLQHWFFRFGYGRMIPFHYPHDPNTIPRRLRQEAGQISSRPPPYGTFVDSLEQIPELKREELRNAGIGQGSIRVTPLQVANSMATLARNGVFRYPYLFKRDAATDQDPDRSDTGQSLGLSDQTLHTVIGGLDAVVNERNGTAFNAFGDARQRFRDQGVTIYGKTGSTENPEHAWFAGYAKDYSGRCLALAVVVEGGQSGARDATPLASSIFQFCIDHQYLGHNRINR